MGVIRKVLGFVGAMLFAVTAASFVAVLIAPSAYFIELFTHMRLVFIALFLISIVLLLIGRQGRLAIASTVLLTVALWGVVSFWFGRPAKQSSISSVRIVQMNLWGPKNHKVKETLAVPKNVDADIIVLSEVTNAWKKSFTAAYPDYKYQIVEPSYGGVALFSRLPIQYGDVRYFSEFLRPRIVADIEARDGSIFRLICVHTFTPFRSRKLRDDELKLVAKEARESKYPAIVCGDINCSPWSPVFTQFLHESGMIDSEVGFGSVPTWAFPIMPFAFIPIDHLFVSKDINVIDRVVGPRFGSDHRPVTVEVGLLGLNKKSPERVQNGGHAEQKS